MNKIILHTQARDGGAFNCFPARAIELNAESVLCNDVVLPWERHVYNVRLWVMGNEFGAMGAVWASCEQDAFDELCDAGLSAGLSCDEPEDMGEEDIVRLGNAGEPHDFTYAWIAPVAFDLQRDVELLAKFAECRGALHDHLGKL